MQLDGGVLPEWRRDLHDSDIVQDAVSRILGMLDKAHNCRIRGAFPQPATNAYLGAGTIGAVGGSEQVVVVEDGGSAGARRIVNDGGEGEELLVDGRLLAGDDVLLDDFRTDGGGGCE